MSAAVLSHISSRQMSTNYDPLVEGYVIHISIGCFRHFSIVPCSFIDCCYNSCIMAVSPLDITFVVIVCIPSLLASEVGVIAL